jgi:hypothetical protein
MAERFALDFSTRHRENWSAFSGAGISNIEHLLLYSIATVDMEANKCNSRNGEMYTAICVVCNLSS